MSRTELDMLQGMTAAELRGYNLACAQVAQAGLAMIHAGRMTPRPPHRGATFHSEMQHRGELMVDLARSLMDAAPKI